MRLHATEVSALANLECVQVLASRGSSAQPRIAEQLGSALEQSQGLQRPGTLKAVRRKNVVHTLDLSEKRVQTQRMNRRLPKLLRLDRAGVLDKDRHPGDIRWKRGRPKRAEGGASPGVEIIQSCLMQDQHCGTHRAKMSAE